jgi:steroid 5-alpha reductase family enzyme
VIKLYLIGLAAIFSFCIVIWLWYLKTKISSVIDVAWSLGILIAGSIYLFWDGITTRKIIIFTFLLAWSLRLAFYLYWTRVRLKHQDKRYDNLSSDWKFKEISFLGHYWLQGFLMSVIAIPFYFISTQNYETFQVIDFIAAGLFIFALIFESISDWQLTKHKKQKSTVCNTGLWKYSRHPNYFFEWLIWVSFALFGLNADNGYLAMVSPLCLLFIVTILTGPMTERASLKSRGEDYAAYKNKTSYFIPWFNKKN